MVKGLGIAALATAGAIVVALAAARKRKVTETARELAERAGLTPEEPSSDEPDVVVTRPTIIEIAPLPDIEAPTAETDTGIYTAPPAAPLITDAGVFPGNLDRMYGSNNWRAAAIPSYDALANMARSYGITTVVNLALDSMKKQEGDEHFTCSYSTSRSKRDQLCEPQWAEALGLNYIGAYMGSDPPSTSTWERIRDALDAGNTLIHCTHGADRTGAVAARYWLERDPAADPQVALDEAYGYGFKDPSVCYYRGDPERENCDPNDKLREWILAGTYQG